jgi:hypothetical protein
MKKSIGLELPERTKPAKDSFDCRPRAVEKWIEELPRASVGRCAQLIYSTLKETNGLDIRHKDRVHMLEAMREPVQYVAQSMKKHFVGTAIPLPEKNQKIAYATREIHLLMAMGYKIAIEDTLSGSLFLDKRHLTTLVHRAISYLSRMLLTTYQIYEPVPHNVWSNLYKLYAHAEMLGLHRTAISDNQHQYINKTTIQGEFTRIMLLSLTSPYHLRRGEVGHVYVNLERWMNLADVHELDDEKVPEGDFIADLDTDNPPSYQALINMEDISDNAIVIDTHRLIDTIYGELQKSEELFSNTLIRVNMENANLSHDLLRRLTASWGPIHKRSHKRVECKADMRIAVGLSATHQAILQYANAHDNFEQSVAEADSQIMSVMKMQSHYHARDVSNVSGNSTSDVWEMIYDHGRLSLVNAKAVESVLDNLPANQHCTMDGWRLLNQSAQGFCLKCMDECGHCLQVGEIIGVSPSGGKSPEHWTVGVIQWMKTEAGKGIVIGGQLLGKAAIPVGISSAADIENRDRIQRALLLPAVKQLDKPSTLITNTGTFREGAVVHVYLPAGTIEMKLQREFSRVGLYSEFQYKQIANISTNKQAKTNATDDSEDFGEVWSTL